MTAIATNTGLGIGQFLPGNYSILDFGADPTGNTNSSARIQGAMQLCSDQGGGWLWFERGSYRLDTALTFTGLTDVTLVIQNGNELTGDGSTLPSNTATCNILDLSGGGSGFTNPMTTAADMIVGGVAGAPARLAKGTAYQVLGMDATAAAEAWMASLQSLLSAKGAIVTATAANTPAVQTVGNNGDVLTANSAQTNGMEWVPGLTNPMTTQGDVIIGGTAGAPARLAIGTAYQYARVNGAATALEYGSLQTGAAAPTTSSPTTNSASYATLAEMSVAVTITTGRALVWGYALVSNDTDSAYTQLALAVDGGTETIGTAFANTTVHPVTPLTTQFLFTGLSVASHTFTLRWLASAGITTNAQTQRSLTILEVL